MSGMRKEKEALVCRPQCPTCRSFDVMRLPSRWSSGDADLVKAEAIRTLLLGRRKNVKRFKCNCCGYEW